MKFYKSEVFRVFLIVFISILVFIFYFHQNTSSYLSFSDGAKFALTARSQIVGRGKAYDFSFFGSSIFKTTMASSLGSTPAFPYIMSFFFRVFGATDKAVIFTSGIFYILLILTTYLLGQRLYGKLTGFLSALAIAANVDFLNYATSGASEPLFAFLAVISLYFIVLKKRWADILFFISLILLYLTRPQGIVFIGVLIFAWLLLNFKQRKALTIFLSAIIGILILDKLVLYPLSFRYPVYSIVTRGIQALFQYSPSAAVSDALRGGTGTTIGYSGIIRKTFYNLYNFYKLLPQIASPYMWGLFFIGLFIWTKDRSQRIFKISTILIVVGSFALTALTIPFYRYLHPVVPFVYILGIDTLVWIMTQIFHSRQKLLILSSSVLIFFLFVGQTLGIIFLDSRFENNTHNVGQPPEYVQLAHTLRDNTNSGQTIVTNLDTWGSWYGERRTIWFPLEPKQLIDPATGKIPFDAIYLTSYLIDDQNYYMGNDWRQIFENSTNPKKWVCDGCDEIAKEFKFKGVYMISASQDYERQNATAILLVKR